MSMHTSVHQVELIKLCVFFKLTADQATGFDWIAGSSQGITLGESKGEHAKAKFQQKLNPGTLLTFLATYCTIVSKLDSL